MTRDEVLKLRNQLLKRSAELKQIGDYGAGAEDIRMLTEAVLALANDRLERMRGGS